MNGDSNDAHDPGVQILEIAHLLQKKFALLPGLTDKDGNPCLILSDEFKNEVLVDDEFFTVIEYLMKIGREIWPKCKYAVVIDRRTDRWQNVRSIVEKMTKIKEDDIIQLLLLKPKGFFQKHFYSSSPTVLFEAAKPHKLFVLDSLPEMEMYVETSNLPEGFGGQFEFDHMEWIEHKTAIERFELTCRKTEKRMEHLRKSFSQEIPLTSIPSIQEMASNQQKLVCDIEDDIKCSQDISETLTTLVEKPFNRKGHSPLSQYNITCLKKWTTYLQTMRDELDSQWAARDKKLEEALSLCQFEEEFCEVSKDILQLTATLESRTDIGEGLETCNSLMAELDDFLEKSMGPYEKMRVLRDKGYAMLFTGQYLVQSVKMRCDEIKRLSNDFDAKLEARKKLLQTSTDVYSCLEQLHAWCKSGVDLLASQSAGSFQTLDGATKGLEEINKFLSSGKGLNMGKMNQINNLCKELNNAILDSKVKEALQRIDEVKDMITNRENSLKKVAAKDKRPVQPVQAFVVKDRASPESPKTPKDKKRRGSHDILDGEEKNAKSQLKEERKKSQDEKTTRLQSREERKKSGEEKNTRFQSKEDRKKSAEERNTKLHGKEDRKKSIEVILAKDSSTNKRHSFRKSFKMRRNMRMTIEVGEEDPAMVKNRSHVMKEMIDTERVYVKDLLCVIEGYYDAYDEDAYDIPNHLRNLKDVIFGNIKEIYNFHKTVFLKELESCQNTPLEVGQLFLSKKEEFQLYATYCKNKPRSEALRKELSSSTFLSDRQAKLGHQLPLDAYLLKPVQRITKYQLLIGEMKKNTNKHLICHGDLQQAADAMKKVLRHVNDVMHSTGLTGFLGNIDDEGRLLLQDSFMVWEVQKKVLKQISNLRGKQRQLFLFERSLIFSKGDPDTGAYLYKGSLKTQTIGLTETVKGDPTKFEIRMHGRTNVYVIQAPSQEVKEIWVVEIRKLLLKQFDSVKENASGSPNTLQLSQSSNDALWRSSAPDLAALSKNSAGKTTPTSKSPNRSPKLSPRIRNKLCGGLPPLAHENRSASDFNIASSYSKSSLLGESEEEGWSEGEFDNDDEEEENEFRYDSQAIMEMASASDASGSVNTPGSCQSEMNMIGYWAIADYMAIDEHELSLVGGEMLRLVHKGDEGWLFVESEDGLRRGWAPASYLETVTEVAIPTPDSAQITPSSVTTVFSSTGVTTTKPKLETAV